MYKANPNTIKTMAPETAARIRSSVNENPYLRDIIQFNGKMLPYAAPVGMAYQQFAKPDGLGLPWGCTSGVSRAIDGIGPFGKVDETM